MAYSAYEDFTTFTEVDPNSRITIDSATKLTATDLTRNETAYVYKDYGSNHFQNFTHHVQNNMVSISHIDALAFPWMMANAIDDWQNLDVAGEDGLNVARLGYLQRTYIQELDAGTIYEDFTNDTGSATEYYLTVQKENTTYTCKIYTDSNRTSLLDTLSLTLKNDYQFRYLYSMSSYSDGNTAKMTITVENLDINEELRRQMILY